MKTIKQVRKEFVCPKCDEERDISLQEENAHCNKCNSDFDLGMKKYK